MTSPYADAPTEKLDEIIRLAEARLAAQLTLGVAADQRAVYSASFLAALDAALITALATLQHVVGHPSVIVAAAGFGVAALLAIWSAQPIAWDIPGYAPSQWLDDIVECDTLHNGRAAMAEHYDEAIGDNDRALAKNANWLRASSVAVTATLFVAGFLAVVAG